ncbi:MAG: dehydrogenase, short-chain alcohol dehydrogenase like protein [Bacilli bacterium]|nr:dehydrogenase, short-chain alcohol dehydrogenase like protein [Bacilli bacterium]
MANRLKDKVVIITGGTKGIGKGVALVTASEGAHVVISGRSQNDGEQVAYEIKQKYNSEVLFIPGDLSNLENCKSLMEKTYEYFGRLDGLVNNAGIFPRATLIETDEDLFDQVFTVNIKSAFFCSKYAIEYMKRGGGGSIVHMGSTHGYKGGEDLAAYACSKGALNTLSKHIAHNYAQYGIRSNWITVGWVASEGEIDRFIKEGKTTQDLFAMAKQRIPSGRLQTSEDMAYGIVYLLSDESNQVTATDLHITGAFNI